MEFKDFNLDPLVLEGVFSVGFEKPTRIQEEVIPMVIEGKDVIACAQTGTGKTAAYLLPLFHQFINLPSGLIKALIIVPTRELAFQIDQQFQGLAYYTGLSSIAIYGGGPSGDWDTQKRALIQGADVVIATPGKLLSHLSMGYVKLEQLQCLILDEADRMLDMGFYEDILTILSFLPEKRQNLMFSATMPPAMRKLAKTILHHPEEINIALAQPAEGVLQVAYMVYEKQKNTLIRTLIEGKTLKSVLIFCSTKEKVKNITRELKKAGLACEEIHSDLMQDQRERVLLGFRNRQIQVLVATDVLSRGIDVEDIDLVINYDVPQDAEDYVHRVGRTARAEATGVAITFINDTDSYRFKRIEQLIGYEIRKMKLPAQFGEGPEYNPKPEQMHRGYRKRPGVVNKNRRDNRRNSKR